MYILVERIWGNGANMEYPQDQTQAGQDVHGGHPVLMYTVRQVYSAEDKLKTVDLEEVAVCKNKCKPKSQVPCD